MGTSPSTSLDLSVSDPSGYEYSVQFESEAFAAGKHRRCYIATLSNEKAPKHNRKVVLKVFKPEYVSKFGFDYECVKDLERSIACHELCIKFNKAMNEYSSHTLPISLPAPLRINIKRYKDELIITTKLISKVFNNIPIKIKNHKYLTVQLFLQNNQSFKYNKLSSNNGWIGDKYEFLSAFSHFSWVHTKGKMLINGFQGLQRGNVLFLSDAIIHSNVLGSNGANDLGMIGIINFFLNHKCSDCCRHLPALNTTLLVQYLSKTSILKIEKATTYLIELNKADLQKDEEKLETVYDESIQQTFADHMHGINSQKQEKCEAGNIGNETGKMEQIETGKIVVEEMNICVDKVAHISCEQSIQNVQNEEQETIEEEYESAVSAVSTSDISDGDDFENEDLIQAIQNEENMENIQIINTDMDGAWFDDRGLNESYHGNDEWEFV